MQLSAAICSLTMVIELGLKTFKGPFLPLWDSEIASNASVMFVLHYKHSLNMESGFICSVRKILCCACLTE